ncbi:RidA family protein [Kineosporia babensis]|uniref:RidA family protein n=1 Tax=Kineosporia babensis TaxID=499548 RepID=A0A9X1NI57_9ACTN|nr:RidA family protein [Kineosporia babensis]MCD5314475.1 RidA family protein [Kineosporia babensis]
MELRNSPALIPPKGHYSHAAVHGGIAYVAGQLPIGRDGDPLPELPFAEQVGQVLDNLDRCLSAAGSDRAHLLSTTVFVTDIQQWPLFDELYGAWLGDHRPARIVAEVARLHFGCAVEVAAVAAVPDEKDF